jgi:hypothetical protein
MDSLFHAAAHDTRPFLLLSGEYASLVTARVNSVTPQTLQRVMQIFDMRQLNQYILTLPDKYTSYLEVVGSFLQITQYAPLVDEIVGINIKNDNKAQCALSTENDKHVQILRSIYLLEYNMCGKGHIK